MRYALGIDGGGTKCDAAVVSEDGSVVGWGRGGPTHHWYDPPEVIAKSYVDALSQALDEITDAQLWVAGGRRSPRIKQVIERAGRIVAHVPAGEIECAYACALEKCGVIILAGTGSFVHVRTPDGRDRHAGGLGPVLGDYGSAYEIGLAGLRAAFASAWIESRRTSLAEALPRALDREKLREVFSLIYDEDALSRRHIAALAKVVDREAEGGDPVAAQCIRDAADDLADLAVDFIQHMNLGDTELPVIACGSVAQKSRIWWARMSQRIAAVAPNMRPIVPQLRPAAGAALLALPEMGVELTPQLVDRILATQQQHMQALQAQTPDSNP